ncbi:MAG: MopE-related protein [Sandaracinaceae bacterium]|nr:MopE-related protein [Sandaracinaceae bacterium]
MSHPRLALRATLALSLVTAGACRSATCPEGFVVAGDRCAPDDGFDAGPADAGDETDAGCPRVYADMDGDGFGDPSRPNTTCPAPAGYVANDGDCDDSDDAVSPSASEACNAVDDDCDERTDEDFDCEQNGTDVPCVTSCGSTGIGSCDATCTATACEPPAETCTYVDDDCDGAVDEGDLQAVLPGGTYGSSTEPARTWTFGGDAPVVFTVYRGGAILAQRFTTDGAPDGAEEVIYTVPLELELATFLVDVARAGDRHVLLAPNAGGTAIEARLFDATTFAAIGTPFTVVEDAGSSFESAQVAADGANVLFAYTEAGDLNLLATDTDLVPRGAANTIASGAVGPIAVAAGRGGSLDWWVAYSRDSGGQIRLQLQKVRPFGTAVGSPTAIDPTTGSEWFPALAVGDGGDVGVLFATGAAGTFQLRFEVRHGTDGSLVGASDIPDPWGVCLYFTVPYCRPSTVFWSGSRWIVAHLGPGAASEVNETRLRVYAPDATPLAGHDGSIALASSMDQFRMPSGAGLPSGLALVTVPTPAEARYALFGCP